jgi:hypothetical protein
MPTIRSSSRASSISVSAKMTWYFGGPGFEGRNAPEPTSKAPTPWYLNGSCCAGS